MTTCGAPRAAGCWPSAKRTPWAWAAPLPGVLGFSGSGLPLFLHGWLKTSSFLGAFYKKQTRLKKDFFELAVQLDKVRLDALDKKRIAEKLESKNRCTATALKAWQPQECAPLPPIQLTDDQLASFQSGASLTVVLCEWAATLQWPNIKHPDDPGIALVELVYNFLLVTQTTLPRIVARSANRVTYEYPTDQGPLALLPGALEDACRLFDALDKQLKKYMGRTSSHCTFEARCLSFDTLVAVKNASATMPDHSCFEAWKQSAESRKAFKKAQLTRCTFPTCHRSFRRDIIQMMTCRRMRYMPPS